eukprot:TRINITY_DN17986_c0_g1_i1.p1 TRINITY_DN17986_c0_g1~~TRINITY_DN17986_c0_g1_i1.p1  ORF type:complete len:114 (-),score=25.02 TRINITY_DN17986_c0_g1_i1:191-508(-)
MGRKYNSNITLMFKHLFSIIYVMFKTYICVNGQIIGVQESPQMGPVSSLMRGGQQMKIENFPWFAFIEIGFPQFIWKIWSEKKKKRQYKKFNKANPMYNSALVPG